MEPKQVVGDYELDRKIGFGAYSVVWVATKQSSGEKFAVKEMKMNLTERSKLKRIIEREVSILTSIDHPNVIRFHDTIETEDGIFLVMEYCSGGDLFYAYVNRQIKVSDDLARHLMRQLAAGLQALQEKHVIHRDLKPQNLFLSTTEEKPILKIGDFGFARFLQPDKVASSRCGSPNYMAPDIFKTRMYNAKADLWSVGVTLFELVTGVLPFDGPNRNAVFESVLEGTVPDFPEELHPDCIDLCRRLLRVDPAERLTLSEFCNHKFLRERSPRRSESREDVHVSEKTQQEGVTVGPSQPRNQTETATDSIEESRRKTWSHGNRETISFKHAKTEQRKSN